MTQPWPAVTPLHLLAMDQHLLVVVLAAGGLATGLLVALSTAALSRRRSLPYGLVTLALSTLLVRVVLGVMGLEGALGETAHHVLEHGLDVLTVALLLGAVYLARRGDPAGGADA